MLLAVEISQIFFGSIIKHIALNTYNSVNKIVQIIIAFGKFKDI